MTKNLLILSLFFLSALKLNAQCTPDNTITKPGFYPSFLPDANVGVAYNEVLQFKILKDTMVMVFGTPTLATVDSATIGDVIGMPDGLTFKLNKNSKTYTPAETGCALISGTPTKGGTFKLKICLMLYAKVSGFSVARADTMNNFSVVVKGTGGMNEMFSQSNVVYPNPLNTDKLFLNSELVLPGTTLSIFNCQGQLLASQKFESTQQSITFNYPKGLYFLSFNNEGKVKMVKLFKE